MIAIGLALASAPMVAGVGGSGDYLLRLLVVGLLYVGGAVAWDLVGGLAGQVSFGHASFFGIGAYATAILTRHDVPFLLTLPAGAVVAALYGAFWGWPCLRLRGPFFAIATIGVGEATRLIALNLEDLTGGATGLTLPVSHRYPYLSYFLALGIACAALAASALVRASRLGLGLSCVRQDIDAAESIGIRAGWLQLQALMASAAMVGLTGCVYARFLYYVEPGDVFSFNRSIAFILMAIIGGVNTLWGPAIGAGLFLVLEQVLAASFQQVHLGIYGLLLVLIMMFEPRGLLAIVERLRRFARDRSPRLAA